MGAIPRVLRVRSCKAARPTPSPRTAAATVSVTSALLLAACSGSDTSSTPTTSPRVTTSAATLATAATSVTSTSTSAAPASTAPPAPTSSIPEDRGTYGGMYPPAYVTAGEDLLASGTPALPFPPGDIESYEPSIAINPNNPDHIVVAAMTGVRFGRGGRDMYRWITRDGGKNWRVALAPSYCCPGKFVADPIVEFDESGRDHLLSMFGDIQYPVDFKEFEKLLFRDAETGRPRREGGDALETLIELAEESGVEVTQGQAMVTGDPVSDSVGAPVLAGLLGDKTSLAIDNSPTSPHRGTIYATWTGFDPSPGLVIAVSRDGGRTFEPSTVVIEGAKPYGNVTVRPDGRVDIVVNAGDGTPESPNPRIEHVVSDDGGRTFSQPDAVREVGEGVWVDLPTIAAASDGTVMACWNESTPTTNVRAYCATTKDDEGWSEPINVDDSPSATGMVGLPDVSSNKDGFWVAAFRTDAQTEVVLYNSKGAGQPFEPVETLATRSFGADETCIGVASDTPCRYDFKQKKFNPTDYLSISAVDQRVAVAFTLTLGNDPVEFATTYVKTIDV
jgi:hypothetical protein